MKECSAGQVQITFENNDFERKISWFFQNTFLRVQIKIEGKLFLNKKYETINLF